MDDEIADVFVNEETEVAGQDFIPVAVSDGDTIEISQCALRAGTRETPADAETVFRRDRWGRERSNVKEYDDSRGSLELLQKVDKDKRRTVWTACFVEEDANTSESAYWRTTHAGREAQYGCITIFLGIFWQLGQQLARRDLVLAFGTPLILLPVAPEDEDTRQQSSETKREPSAVRDFRESRRKIKTIERRKHEEAGEDNQKVQAPDEQGYEGHHTSGDEGDKDDTYTVGFSELGRLFIRLGQLRYVTRRLNGGVETGTYIAISRCDANGTDH